MNALRFAMTVTGCLAVVAMAVPAAAQTVTSAIDIHDFDTTASPCVDFYQYVNGGWLANNPIPSEYSSWSTWSEIEKRNYKLLHQILIDAAAETDAKVGSVKQIVGDFYYTAMDTATIEAQGTKPLEADFARIADIGNLQDLQTVITSFQRERARFLFDLDVEQDYKNSEQNMIFVSQGGLGLPNRDYYTRQDQDSKDLRDKYVAHMTNMFKLLGEPEDQAQARATSVLATETRLAEASLTNVELRDPDKQYHPVTINDAAKITPDWSWPNYFKQLGVPSVERFSLGQPVFFATMDTMLTQTSLDDWKSYLTWHLIHAAAPYLSEPFVKEDFAFYHTTMRGTQELQPRWRRFLNMANWYVGEPIGQLFVAQAFPPEAKARALEMINNLRAALKERIQNLDWMGPETKEMALKKVATFMPKIGYPDKWRDYSTLKLDRSAYVTNVRKVRAFSMQYDLNKIGKPVDRTEWGMAPQIVNAYYNPSMNEVVFPAAILQPPFFDPNVDDAVNYGAIGAIIGHELSHGFDDEGSKFDDKGNYNDWWTDADRKKFDERTKKLVEQYDGYVAVDSMHVNGQLTLGENIADLDGLTLSFHALMKAIAGKDLPKIDGFTPEQRFFIAYARNWRINMRPASLKMQINTDPHSPGHFRAIGPLQDLLEFRKAFSCQDGDPMVRSGDARVEIW